MNDCPRVEVHAGVHVVRDDLYPGGTKARFIPLLFAPGVDEVVYASPAEGGAQIALATVARSLGKRATIFVAKRAQPHPRVLQAKSLGAKIVQIAPGYLSVVQARARKYCNATGATLAPFGMDVPEAVDIIAKAALATKLQPAEVWCAAGSGTLAKALIHAWPSTLMRVVSVGRQVGPSDIPGVHDVHSYPRPFDWAVPLLQSDEFPSDRHYDAKAWEICKARRSRTGLCLFWNVLGVA